MIGVLLSMIISCTSSGPNRPVNPPQTYPTTTPTLNARNIRNVCDFFHFRAHETLLTLEGQGNAELYASRDGVPIELERTVRAYYANGVRPSTPAARNLLDERYADVIRTCQKFGWKEG